MIAGCGLQDHGCLLGVSFFFRIYRCLLNGSRASLLTHFRNFHDRREDKLNRLLTCQQFVGYDSLLRITCHRMSIVSERMCVRGLNIYFLQWLLLRTLPRFVQGVQVDVFRRPSRLQGRQLRYDRNAQDLGRLTWYLSMNDVLNQSKDNERSGDRTRDGKG